MTVLRATELRAGDVIRAKSGGAYVLDDDPALSPARPGCYGARAHRLSERDLTFRLCFPPDALGFDAMPEGEGADTHEWIGAVERDGATLFAAE